MSTVLHPQATVADAIEQTLEWLDRQGCGERNGHDRRYNRRGRYRVNARIQYLPPGLWSGPKQRQLAPQSL